MIKSSKNLAVRMSIKLPIGSRRKNFRQSWTMFAELVRNNFINDRLTVNSRERLSRTNLSLLFFHLYTVSTTICDSEVLVCLGKWDPVIMGLSQLCGTHLCVCHGLEPTMTIRRPQAWARRGGALAPWICCIWSSFWPIRYICLLHWVN